jgi:hypothetical protein
VVKAIPVEGGSEQSIDVGKEDGARQFEGGQVLVYRRRGAE